VELLRRGLPIFVQLLSMAPNKALLFFAEEGELPMVCSVLMIRGRVDGDVADLKTKL
jgi:hypothetical protein